MRAWVSHPFGNANVRAVLKALYEHEGLEAFFTTISHRKGSLLSKALPGSLRREMERRAFDLPPSLVHTNGGREWVRQIAVRMKWGNPAGWAHGIWQAHDKRVARKLARTTENPSLVYAYEDGALETFWEAGQRGIPRVYDLPIGFHKSARWIFAEDAQRLPEFAGLIGGLHEPEEKLERKDRELALADRIICPGSFVFKTLTEAGVDKERIRTVTFGTPGRPPRKDWATPSGDRPLTFLFVGRLSQRKGIGYLCHAARKLKGANVKVLGPGDPTAEPLSRYKDCVEFLPPRPQAEVFEEMARADVFVLPSLFEGQALVVLEAMACGLPVLITPHTGYGGIVSDGKEGRVVEAGNGEALLEAMEWFLDNRTALPEMGREAGRLAEKLTWERYGADVLGILEEMQA